MPERDALPPIRRRGRSLPLALAATCLALLGMVVGWLMPGLTLLGANHRSVVTAIVESELHELPGAEPRRERLTLRRTERAVVADGTVAVVQTTLAWLQPGSGGPPLSQTTELFGVHRATRAIQGGYGDRERSGSFGFPPDAPRASLRLWDAFHPGPVTARFELALKQGGVELYRYTLEAEEADASATYANLALVPDRYRVRSAGRGWALVEPRTGLVVDRRMELEARFVLASDGSILGQAHRLEWQYSEADRIALLEQARQRLRWLGLLGFWAPLLLALGVAGGLVAALRRGGRG